jgi:hypothetical protein
VDHPPDYLCDGDDDDDDDDDDIWYMIYDI